MFVRMFTETKKDNHGGVKRILLWKNRSFEGLIARVIQHEYDHM
jgi:hypothetical protein